MEEEAYEDDLHLFRNDGDEDNFCPDGEYEDEAEDEDEDEAEDEDEDENEIGANAKMCNKMTRNSAPKSKAEVCFFVSN